MKFISFEKSGKAGYGTVINDRVIDLSKQFADRFPDMRAVLEADALPELQGAASTADADYDLADVTLLRPVPNPR
ncbi:MAG: DUF2437 domain-containing protein, partial [Alphaproteobacteria bacterium]|nr:DUF2437 domain-containing protein [Alphaproteobacteria bacterium]